MVTKTSLVTQKLGEQHIKTFKVAKWRVKTKSESLLVIVIYHPPYSTTNQTTNSAFLDEFTDWITMDLAHEKNIFNTGDFNIHINNSDTDDDASTFLETIEAMGLQQHVNFDTHRKGKTLDLSAYRILQCDCNSRATPKDHSYQITVLYYARHPLKGKTQRPIQ